MNLARRPWLPRLFISKKIAAMIGTQGCAPPEQYEGKAEPRSDLYALGVTMFHLLTPWDPALAVLGSEFAQAASRSSSESTEGCLWAIACS